MNIFIPHNTILLGFNLFPDRRPVEGVGNVEEEEEGADQTVEENTQQNTLEHHKSQQSDLASVCLSTFRREKQYKKLSSFGILQDIFIR